jgi:hypothetical protein
MWAWIKRSVSTDEAQKHNRQLQKLLADSLKDSQALNQRLAAALDRVIESKFDRPVIDRPSVPQPVNGFHIPMEHMQDVLTVEDDREFLETVNA